MRSMIDKFHTILFNKIYCHANVKNKRTILDFVTKRSLFNYCCCVLFYSLWNVSFIFKSESHFLRQIAFSIEKSFIPPGFSGGQRPPGPIVRRTSETGVWSRGWARGKCHPLRTAQENRRRCLHRTALRGHGGSPAPRPDHGDRGGQPRNGSASEGLKGTADRACRNVDWTDCYIFYEKNAQQLVKLTLFIFRNSLYNMDVRGYEARASFSA